MISFILIILAISSFLLHIRIKKLEIITDNTNLPFFRKIFLIFSVIALIFSLLLPIIELKYCYDCFTFSLSAVIIATIFAIPGFVLTAILITNYPKKQIIILIIGLSFSFIGGFIISHIMIGERIGIKHILLSILTFLFISLLVFVSSRLLHTLE